MALVFRFSINPDGALSHNAVFPLAPGYYMDPALGDWAAAWPVHASPSFTSPLQSSLEPIASIILSTTFPAGLTTPEEVSAEFDYAGGGAFTPFIEVYPGYNEFDELDGSVFIYLSMPVFDGESSPVTSPVSEVRIFFGAASPSAFWTARIGCTET